MHFTYTLGPFYKQAVKHRWNWAKAHGLILGSTQKADEENTQHKHTDKEVLCECWADTGGEHPLPGVMDTALNSRHGALTSLTPARTLP